MFQLVSSEIRKSLRLDYRALQERIVRSESYTKSAETFTRRYKTKVEVFPGVIFRWVPSENVYS